MSWFRKQTGYSVALIGKLIQFTLCNHFMDQKKQGIKINAHMLQLVHNVLKNINLKYCCQEIKTLFT